MDAGSEFCQYQYLLLVICGIRKIRWFMNVLECIGGHKFSEIAVLKNMSGKFNMW